MSKYLWTQKLNFGPRARLEHAMVFDPARQRSILFGGNSIVRGLLNDTWEWDGESWVQIADMGPAPRSGHAMAYDTSRGRIVLFGGNTGHALAGDTWEWEGEFWVQVASTGPTARTGHAIVYDSKRNRCLLFGGESADAELPGDTWEWDGTVWIQVENAGPPGRKGHVLTFDTGRKQAFLFGGHNGEVVLGDTWKWDGSSWIAVTSFGANPCMNAGMAYTGSTAMLFGGRDATALVFGDTWEWNGKRWLQTRDMGPLPRWGHAMAYDVDRTMVTLFGGSAASVVTDAVATEILGDTWELFIGATLPTADVMVTTIARFGGYFPRQMATDTNDDIYVTLVAASAVSGLKTASILRLNVTGQVVGSFGDWEAYGIAVDAEKNVYLSSSSPITAPVLGQEFNLIKRISETTGEIVTFAGSGEPGLADGMGTEAQFNIPMGLAIGTAGNLCVADHGNHCIRMVAQSGEVTTVAGNGVAGFADGASTAAQFNAPTSVACDEQGNIYVADRGNNRIRKIDTSGEVSTLAGNGSPGFADGPGVVAQFNGPADVACDFNGNVYVADSENHRIRKIEPSGEVTTLAGSGIAGMADGPADVAQFYRPSGVACDSRGNIYVSAETGDIDDGGYLRRVGLS